MHPRLYTQVPRGHWELGICSLSKAHSQQVEATAGEGGGRGEGEGMSCAGCLAGCSSARWIHMEKSGEGWGGSSAGSSDGKPPAAQQAPHQQGGPCHLSSKPQINQRSVPRPLEEARHVLGDSDPRVSGKPTSLPSLTSLSSSPKDSLVKTTQYTY